MADFIWRVRAALEFARRMGPGWYGQAWGVAGALVENRDDQTPAEAVEEELSCWTD